ncbi:hypothetical protein C472_00444 [Halorubrum tebenquichense DSM 14210]|uniref:Uncharacterized protein n=1 Tax=Halorubrum tebenquichense DSM 14210 TaxID=1227485 RepID=M0E252_9EURY|nr:hypothetical protein C472_00444 [Halorubrum tebenquichense DSM 14210]
MLTGTIAYLGTDGGTLGTLLQGAVFGTIVSLFTGGVNLIQSIFNLVTSPLDSLATAASTVIDATVIDPLTIITETASTSATAIGEQFGPFALIVGVATVLAAFWLIIQFQEREATGNVSVLPVDIDVPDIGPLDIGADEEDPDEQ